MVDQRVLFVIHWLHVFLGVYWIGTVMYTRTQLFPSLRTLPPDHDAAVRSALVTGRNRRLNAWIAIATVGLGLLRGLLARALDDPTSSYGMTFLASAVLGLAMVVFLVAPGPRGPLLRKVYVAAFPVIFTFMILMRFGW
ncbi:MAG: hypothetical protein ACRD29_16455 [Acidimicrobiales bacterium]